MPIIGVSVAFIACLLAFAATGLLVVQPGIPHVDTATTTSIHDLASPGLDALMTAVTGLGSTVVLAALVGVAAVALASRGHGSFALFMAVALVGSSILNDALKLLFARARPGFDWAEVRPEFGFPSGHAMNSFVVYVALALVARRLWGRRAGIVAMALAIAGAVTVGVTRVYLGVHWLTDVIGGFLAGAMWLIVAAGLVAAGVSVARTKATRAAPQRHDHGSLPPR